MTKTGLYVHIPFCLKKCSYCDFPSSAEHSHLHTAYVNALCWEIKERGEKNSQNVDTVYIGGGTPTALPSHLLLKIIKQIKSSYNIDHDAEFSIEANPGTVTEESLFLLKQAGVNRISIGVQSTNDELLKLLGRIHCAAEAEEIIKQAHKMGFENINVDLMYDLPTQKCYTWQETLNHAVQLPITHISAYGLIIEEETEFSRAFDNNTLSLPTDDEQECMYKLVNSYLPSEGYIRYEISNYAKNGFVCRHNLKYWQYEPYIGMGLAAHSFNDNVRTANISDINEYIKVINKNEIPTGITEKLSQIQLMSEFCFLALRTIYGINITKFENKFNTDFMKTYEKQVTDLKGCGLLNIVDNHARLTEKGLKFGNRAFAAFVV